MNVATSAVLAHSWLLLIHQLPARPAYLRVKIWRRLQGIGAIAVKNAVHVVPMNEETQGDFAARGRKRCRLHGGLSPGAPRGSGNYTNGEWIREALEERR